MTEVITDFINLVFGDDTESTVFWNTILLPKMWRRYDLSEDAI